MDIIAKHKPFKNTGEDFSNSNPMFAYYFYKYYISVIKPIFEEAKDPSEKAELEVEVKEAFKRMNALGTMTQIDPSDEVNMKIMLQYTELMFAKNDHFHQEGMLTKQIAEDYLTIFRLYEVVKRFSSIDQGQDKRRVYSKKKFIDIMKEIKKNPAIETNQPSKVVAESVKKSVVQPPPPVFKEEPQKIQKIQAEIQKSHFKPLPKPSKLISYDKITMQMDANRALENAISELSFDRFKHARDELLHALELLDQMIE